MSDIKTALRQAIRDLHFDRQLGASLPAISATRRAAERIVGQDFGLVSPPGRKDFDDVAKVLLKLCADGVRLDWRQARDGAWCLWGTSPALSETPAALRGVLSAIEAHDQRRQPFRALASSWITHFDPARPGIREAAAVLARHASKMGAPWEKLHEAYGFFDVEAGPRMVGRAALSQRVSPVVVLQTGGLGSLDAAGSYVRSCLAACLTSLADKAEPDALARLGIVRALAVKPAGGLVFEELAPLVVDALLRPFGDSTPAHNVRDPYLSLLLELFGDPRLRSGRWARMREAEPIVRRWLTEQSLRQFLDLAGEAAATGDENSRHMWPERRKFWEAVYRKGLISEAWAIFDPRGERLARRAFGDGASFGRFGSKGRKAILDGHTVLLLRIGRGIVADWNFNGACNIWSDAELAGAPKLYRGSYSSDDVNLRSSAGSDIHSPTFRVYHNGNWQSRVAAKLHHMTGVRVPGYF